MMIGSLKGGEQIMKIGMMGTAVIQKPAADSAVKQKSDNSNFQMVLGTLLTNGNKGESNNTLVQVEVDPITTLLNVFEDPIELEFLSLEGNEQIQLEELVDRQYPNWYETFQSLLGELLSNIDQLSPEGMDSHMLLDESLGNEDFLSASTHLMQLLSAMNIETINKLPVENVVALIRAGREFQAFPQLLPLSMTEMKKLDQLDQTLEHLMSRLQEMNNQNRLERVANSLDLAFSRGSEKQESVPFFQQHSIFQQLPKKLTVESAQVNSSSTETVGAGVSNVANQQISRIEQFTLHLNNRTNEETKMRDFVKEFSNIIARSSLTQGQNTTRLIIRLYPEQLGSLRIELLQRDGMMMARMMASTSAAKDMLDSQLHSLKQAFTQQNIQVDKVEVTVSQGETQRYLNQDGRGEQHPQGEQRHQETVNTEHDENGSFKEALSNMLFETEV